MMAFLPGIDQTGDRRRFLPLRSRPLTITMTNLMDSLKTPPNPNIPDMKTGDNVKVHIRIVEGERERVQVFPGTIIRLRRGDNGSFTVRRIASHGVGVERTFLLTSPRVEKVEVVRHAHVRRARLFFLRRRQGREATLKEKR
jgi:large subunit ribosomal protein L19